MTAGRGELPVSRRDFAAGLQSFQLSADLLGGPEQGSALSASTAI